MQKPACCADHTCDFCSTCLSGVCCQARPNAKTSRVDSYVEAMAGGARPTSVPQIIPAPSALTSGISPADLLNVVDLAVEQATDAMSRSIDAALARRASASEPPTASSPAATPADLSRVANLAAEQVAQKLLAAAGRGPDQNTDDVIDAELVDDPPVVLDAHPIPRQALGADAVDPIHQSTEPSHIRNRRRK